MTGDAVPDSTYAFTAKIEVGDKNSSCTGALVDAQYILTASSCFAAGGQPAFPVPPVRRPRRPQRRSGVRI
ncbi:trypsin-like serine protease [Streptomyces sp. NPDC012486]|uniref:trypsin-like serine protease n=1 Tax=unclassified Streptomyces TaxID=2593676 RepID=UPI0033E6765D